MFCTECLSTTKLSSKPKDRDYTFLKRSIELKLFKEIFPQDKKKKSHPHYRHGLYLNHFRCSRTDKPLSSFPLAPINSLYKLLPYPLNDEEYIVHVHHIHSWPQLILKNWHHLSKQEQRKPQKGHLGSWHLQWCWTEKRIQGWHLVISTLDCLKIFGVSALLKNQTTYASSSTGNKTFWNLSQTLENSVAGISEKYSAEIGMD